MSHRSDLQRQVELLLRSNVDLDSGLNFCVESVRRDGDLIFSGQKVRGDVETVFISGNRALDSGRQILDHDLCIRDFRSGSIGDGTCQGASRNLCERRRHSNG